MEMDVGPIPTWHLLEEGRGAVKPVPHPLPPQKLVMVPALDYNKV